MKSYWFTHHHVMGWHGNNLHDYILLFIKGATRQPLVDLDGKQCERRCTKGIPSRNTLYDVRSHKSIKCAMHSKQN